jgi:DNA polymerase-1
MAQNPRIFFVDAYALIYRSYYAFLRSPMFNAEGLNTSVLYGFLSALEDIRTKEKPTHLAVAFDTSAPTFRHRMYEPYKANREGNSRGHPSVCTPAEGYPASLPYPILECEGYEADDIIGTLARQAAEKSFNVFMVTPDKDFVQLVDSRVFLYKPSRSGRGLTFWVFPRCALSTGWRPLPSLWTSWLLWGCFGQYPRGGRYWRKGGHEADWRVSIGGQPSGTGGQTQGIY